MLNLLVSFNEDTWDTGEFKIEKTRFCEYTRHDIRERYLDFHQNKNTKRNLLSYPCLFVIEDEKRESRIGTITELSENGKYLIIQFNLDNTFPPIPKGKIR